MTVATDRVLEHLRKFPGATMQELREALGIHRRTASTVLRRLRDQGVLAQRVDLRDPRRMRNFLIPSVPRPPLGAQPHEPATCPA